MALHGFARCLSCVGRITQLRLEFCCRPAAYLDVRASMSSKRSSGRTGIFPLQDPRHIETAWGAVVIVRRDGSVSVLHEKGLSAKLELLYAKSLFLVALNLAQSEEVRRCLPAPSHKSYTLNPQQQVALPRGAPPGAE